MKQNGFSKSRMIAFLPLAFCLLIAACSHINVYEKSTAIPKYEWQYNFVPSFQFNITDTASQYNLYIVLRHTDAYNYNNICLNIGGRSPGDTMRYQRVDLPLGTDAGGWEGSGMDDIWEIRKPITSGLIKFKKAGEYQFTVAQVMRENPLKNVMNIGIRVEKAN